MIILKVIVEVTALFIAYSSGYLMCEGKENEAIASLIIASIILMIVAVVK